MLFLRCPDELHIASPSLIIKKEGPRIHGPHNRELVMGHSSLGGDRVPDIVAGVRIYNHPPPGTVYTSGAPGTQCVTSLCMESIAFFWV